MSGRLGVLLACSLCPALAFQQIETDHRRLLTDEAST